MVPQQLPKLPTDLPKLPTDLPKLPPLPALPKLPSVEDLSKSPEQLPDTPPPNPAPEAPEAERSHVDNFGWIKNLPESTLKYVKSIVFDLPKATIESAIHYAKDPKQYTKDLSLVFQKNNGLGRFFKEQMVDYYANDFWKNFNEDPAHALGDVAAVLSLGGGTLAKAGELGKLSTLARTGRAVSKVGNYADPLMWAGKGAAKIAAPALEGLGFGKWSRDWIGGAAHLKASHSLSAHTDVNNLIKSKLTPEQNALVERLNRWGYVKELDEIAKQPETVAGRWHKIWREIVTGGEEEKFKDIRVLDDEMAKNANALAASEYSKAHYKELNLPAPVTPKEARGLMDAGIINPTFMSTYRLRGAVQDFFEVMNKPAYRGGAWSRFERRGVSEVPKVTDMDAIAARQIAQRADALYKIDLIDFTKQLMTEKGETIFVGRGGDHAGVPNTHAPIQDAFHRKYWLDMIKGGEANVQFLSSAENPLEGLAAAKKVIEENPEIMKAINANGDIYVPKHIAALLNREIAPISALGKMYDTTLGHFKGLATVWNPRFWGSVIFGNSMLGLLYGISPDVARWAYKYRGDMPAELKALTRSEIYMRDKGIFSRVTNSLGEAAQVLDNIFRTPIFVSEIAKEMHARSLNTVSDFFSAQKMVAEGVKRFGAAPEKLMAARLRISKLEREISTRSPALRKLAEDLKSMEPAVAEAERLKKTVYKPQDPDWNKAMDLLDRYGNLQEAYKSKIADEAHILAELADNQRALPSLRDDAAVADRAIEAGNRFFGSYARLSPFERKVVRRILPFYTFNKAMTMLAFRFPYLYPKRAFVGAHLAQSWFDITSDENSYMPARLKNYVPVAAMEDGSVVAISAGYLNPMAGIRVGNVAELPVPSVFNPMTGHPVIQLFMRMNGAIPEWSGKPLSPGAYATRLDNGTVIQWTGQGFKTTIAQPSVFKSIADLFPQAQLIDKLLHRYAQTDRGWLFNPDPILGPDGKPRYPKELVDILLSNVIPTQTYNRDEVRRVEQAKMAAVLKSYVKDLRYASPRRRDQILEVLSGWRDEKNRKWVN